MSNVDATPDDGTALLTLPVADVAGIASATANHNVNATPRRLPMTPVLALTLLAAAVGLSLAGWQISRAMNGEQRIEIVSLIEIGCALVAAIGTMGWTWIVVENARRLLAAGQTSSPPSPSATAAAWTAPLIVAIGAVGTVAYLERRLNDPDFETTSPIPMGIACVALIATLFVSYRPLFMLSAVMRRLGGGAGDLARWVWVPISLAIVGGFTLFGLRSGGAYGDDFDGIAPAWALGVVFIPPALIVLVMAWRGGRLVEEVVGFAYDRRAGKHAAGVGKANLGVFARALRADARPPIHRDLRARIRLVPGTAILRLAMMIGVAALTLISVVGALVMFLFWREATDGALLPSQRERAWNALGGLQDFERLVAVGVLVLATLWAFVNVLNARLASGRRRNPAIAAAAWPAAGAAIWWIADRFAEPESIWPLVLRFALQAAVLYVPFFLLERAAVAVGARRSPLRLAYALGVVLLVHVQGLGGLATLVEETDVDRFGRIAGYLALAALLELIGTVAITESSRLIGDAASSVAEKHNFLADQRAQIDQRVERTAVPAPAVPGQVEVARRGDAAVAAQANPEAATSNVAADAVPVADSVPQPDADVHSIDVVPADPAPAAIAPAMPAPTAFAAASDVPSAPSVAPTTQFAAPSSEQEHLTPFSPTIVPVDAAPIPESPAATAESAATASSTVAPMPPDAEASTTAATTEQDEAPTTGATFIIPRLVLDPPPPPSTPSVIAASSPPDGSSSS